MASEEPVEWKSIEFDESQLGQLSAIGSALFSDPSDPRSMDYPRVLIRPAVNWKWLALWVLLMIGLPALSLLVLNMLGASSTVRIAAAILAGLIVFCVTLKRFVIEWIRIYQRFAPEALRRRCRFEPSCSQYMIRAIEKYGLLSGVRRGIGRLRRCNIRGGGFDDP